MPSPVADGWRVTDEIGRTVGRVEGAPREGWLLIHHKHQHYFLVPEDDTISGGDSVFLPYASSRLNKAPHVDPEEITDSAYEQAKVHFRA